VKVALYARVSTEGQDPEVQLSALRSHVAQRGWEIWGGDFQAVLVWRFDRFARSVKHLITALEQFRTLNINFISLQEQFDTSTPIGHAMFTIIGAMAQLERDIIRERVKAGLERARARGVRLGRPSAGADPDQIAALRSQGLSFREIARELHCSRSTVIRRLAEAGHGQ
jgi:DNA invertase Pin-like site-specific DNA recombinase